jgi:hypothetical protein
MCSVSLPLLECHDLISRRQVSGGSQGRGRRPSSISQRQSSIICEPFRACGRRIHSRLRRDTYQRCYSTRA